ncbi:MAG: hypothetical protein R3296_13785 [Oleiphilaceae bacterium]|nr:hypothetical protein [Oleiphilaceae bacterium]
MKIQPLFLLLAVSTLSGCQTSGYMASAANDGQGVTCNKIHQAFSAYDQDRQSATALAQLTQLVNPSAGSLAEQGIESTEAYYGQIKAITNITLSVRGCRPV